ncbi:amidohydrolase family protein [Brevundimonas faecalis]|uniref:Imidazolonepropionase-like amidohydrolase/Tol biopolymer transport system component n=1 Tax=Brevundimonas faecalis TaxID=947378 RepID=A0ABV2RAG1_9CAUL
MKRRLLTTVAALAVAFPAYAHAAGQAAGSAPAPATETAKWDVQNPMGPSRDIRIDVNEGTWMSVDVSPDGTEILFDLLGDIYALPIGGGEARPVSSGVAWDMQAKYSPDGRFIAFTSDRGGGDNIWVMNRDGSNPRQVSNESFRLLTQPDWSPDGQFIVGRKHFTSSRSLGAGEMWMYHRGGGGAGVQLTERRTQQKDTGEPAFSPDGRYLYYSDDSTPGGVFEYSKDPNSQIYVIQRLDRETGQVEPYVTGPGGSIRPTPSPDGKSLAFIRRDRYQSVLYVMDIESGRETPIYDALDRDMQETWAIHGVYPTMSWTPDNRSIVFWAGGKIRRIDVASKAVSDIPFHVADTRRVQETVRFPVEVAPAQFDVKMIRWAQTSPDGSKVVFEALGNLWIRDLRGGVAGAPRRLTRQSDHFELYPSWSRDGRSIVYTTWNDQDLGTLRVIPAAGGEGRVISAHPGHYLEPQFSPDGQTVVYRTASDGYLRTALWARDPGVYRVSVRGGEPVKITADGVHPQFGLRNDRIFLTDRQGDKRVLKSVNLSGEDARTHLSTDWASEFSVSPDERWVAWTERFNAYVAPFAAAGRAVTVGVDAKAVPQARVTRDAGEWLHWSGDSSRLQWSLGPELFSRPLTDSFAFVDGAAADLPRPAEHGIKIGFSADYAKPAGVTVLSGARLITMKGDEVVEDGVVVVNGNRIEAIGPRGSVTVPAGARVIDMTGKTIIPGLVDAHWHGRMGADEIIPQQSWVNYAALAFGVTTLHDPSNDSSEIFAHSELAKAGRVVAPRIFSTGTILYGAATPSTAVINNIDEARSNLRRMQAIGAWSVKSYNQPRRDQRQQIIQAARELGMMVVPEGGSLYQQNMSMLVDGHTTIEHSIPVARMYADSVQLWSQTGTAYTPTPIVGFGGAWGENYWYETTDVWNDPILTQYVPRRVLDSRSRRPVKTPENELNHISITREAKRLADAGVSVQMGAHGQREGLGAHWELWMFEQGGMTPHEALRVGTLNGARALGMDKDIGSLEVGKLADLVVLNANPLENLRDTTKIGYTMINGRLFDDHMNEVGGAERRPFWHQSADGQAWATGLSATAAESHTHTHD